MNKGDVLEQVQIEKMDVELLPQAVLHRSIAGIEGANGIRFSHYQDDLDGFDAALLRITSMDASRAAPHPLWAQTAGATGLITKPASPEAADGCEPFLCLLQRYDGEPADNLTVFLPKNVSVGAARRHTLQRMLNALALAGSDLIWEHTDSQSR